jgi:putative heme iron utilization protein
MSNLSSDAAAAMMSHMNDDHADAVIAYARYYGGATDIDAARITAMDSRGIIVTVSSGTASKTIPIAFDHELADADDGRNTLIAMYRQASTPQST